MKFCVLLLTLLFWTQSIWATDLNQPLKVGLAGSAPFIIKAANPQDYSGISYHLWKQVAQKANIQYELSTPTNVEQGLKLLQQNPE